MAEHDPDEIYATDILFGERHSHRSMTMAVEWTRHALRVGELDEQGFMERFGHEASRIFRGHPDLPRRTALELTLNMHKRHSSAVKAVLKNTLDEKTAELVDRSLPETCLVRLHIGHANEALDQVPQYPSIAGSRVPISDIDEVDEVPEAGSPLCVSFSMDGARHVVDMTTVFGPPARVPHALKPAFDEGRRIGIAPADHRYQIGTTLPDLGGMNKTSIRKAVARCRKQIATEYERLHGEPPPEHLLIQTKRSKGYRLDPGIIIVSPIRAS